MNKLIAIGLLLVFTVVLSTKETPCISFDYDEGCEVWLHLDGTQTMTRPQMGIHRGTAHRHSVE